MSNRTGKAAAIFPGQGAQTVGMGKDVYEALPVCRELYDRANEVLGFDLASFCFHGPAEKLEQTDVQQPAILVTSLALWEAYRLSGGSREQFGWAGGLSLGEYTALCFAGATSFEDAVKLVHRRGTLMQEAAAASPGGMVSLIGADEEKARRICDRAAQGDVLVPANLNAPEQIVLSGTKEACTRAQIVAEEFDCRAVPLTVAGAFHSPLMAPAASGLRSVLAGTSLKEPALPVVANVDGSYHGTADRVRMSLENQVTHAVHWQACVERMIADGAASFVEFGPGRVLTGLMRKINRQVPCVNVSSLASVTEAAPV